MAVCTFFGHRDTPRKIEPILKSTLIDLIENKKVDLFYIGNQGNFDYMVRKKLKELKHIYKNISYIIVLAYMPTENNKINNEDNYETLFPFEIENTPPKFAISNRNKWMINQSDYVVTYVKYSVGGAAHFKSIAEKKGKTVINIE